MRILHVITSLRTGGAEHLLVGLLPRLRNLGHDVELLLFDGTRTPFYEKLESQGITVNSLSVGESVYSPKHIVRLRKIMKQYDIVHTHNTACQLFAAIAKATMRECPRLLTTEHSSNNRRRGNWLYEQVDKWMYSRYDSIICIADKPRQNLELEIGRKKSIVTIHNGVDTQEFHHPLNSVAEKSSFVVTMVASLSEAKDQETLVRAFSLLPENYSLKLIGDGPRRTQLVCLIEKCGIGGRVSLLGVRNDVSEQLALSDVVVLSSHWEGLSLSSIEGMASGRPFIASDVDGLREVVQGAGILFEHGNHEQLANEIRRLCENPDYYAEVARRCQKRASQYDISLMAQRYHDLYQGLFKSL